MTVMVSAATIDRRGYLKGFALAIGGAVLFSGKAIVAKLFYRYAPDPVLLITLRMALSAPLFAVLGWWQSRGAAPMSARDRLVATGLGLIGYYLSSYLDFVGLQYISVGLERLILFLTPSFVLLITAVWLKRRIRLRQWIALAVAYAGIVVVFAHDLQLGGGRIWLGSSLVLGTAVLYAIYLIGSGELLKRIGALRLVAYMMGVSTVACFIQFALLRPLSVLAQPAPVWSLSLVNAVFCTVAPVIMTMMAVKRVAAPIVSQASMIGPVSTLFLGYWLLGEPITAWQAAGSALVIAGIAMLSRR